MEREDIERIVAQIRDATGRNVYAFGTTVWEIHDGAPIEHTPDATNLNATQLARSILNNPPGANGAT